MLLIGIFYIFNWSYAKRKKYFIKEMTQEHYEMVKKIDYILPVAAMLAIAITFISPLWSPVCYFSIFIFKALFKRGIL
jgi:hypothetical protein